MTRTTADTDREERINQVLLSYLQAVKAGHKPDRDQVLAANPELCGELEARFADYDEVNRLSAPLREASRLDREGAEALKNSRQTCLPAAAAELLGASAEATTDIGQLGDFRLLREVGRGGMGVVYEAEQISLRRRVALKVLPFAATFDVRQLQRFKNEAQAAALLHHPHIVAVHAVGCERGVHFYAMQLIDGQSLAVIIRQLREETGSRLDPPDQSRDLCSSRLGMVPDAPRGGVVTGLSPGKRDPGCDTLPHSTLDVSAVLTAGTSLSGAVYFRKIARLMVQAAGALEHAHQLGVVHRDVKPANLLVNASGNLWVTDFGLAQLQADNGLTRSGDLLGTFRYMSPEQTSGQRAVLDHRTDIYSLGATFYELLTLEPVFDGETRQELLYQILHQEPRPPRQVDRAIPTELETIVLKALSKTPADRYATAAELAADVQRYLDDQPIHARRPSLVDRVRKWSRRHPSAVVASMLLLTVLAVGLFISNRLISREKAKLVVEQEKTAKALTRESERADEEKLRANEAEAHFQQARRAFDIVIDVSRRELAHEPMVRAVRVQMLQAALDYYQSYIAHRRDGVSTVPRAEIAAIQERVGDVLDALTVYRQESRVFHQELMMHLLWSPPVLEDLGLIGNQTEQVAELRQGWLDAYARACDELQNGGELTWRSRFVELAEQYELRLANVLSLQQRTRLDQIAAQTVAEFAFNGPAIVQALRFPSGRRASADWLEFAEFADARVPSTVVRRRPEVGKRRNLSLEEAFVRLLERTTDDWRNATGRPFAGFRALSTPRPLGDEQP
ncbi:MAG: protein kinase domain-containing protein [Planctomycetaceae bacterium]